MTEEELSRDAPVSRRRFLSLTGGAGVAVLVSGALPAAPGRSHGRRAALRSGAPTSPGAYPLDSAIYGGELQYFRMDPAAIPARLALCRQASYRVIQTYVPWNVHEFLPGVFDFSGQTHPVLPNDHHLDPFEIEDPITGTSSGGTDGRLGILCNTDLTGFLTECDRLGFKLILRPGPFISDEWRNGGVPDWLLETAPESMYMYGPDGTALTPGAPFSAPPPVAAAAGGMSEFYFPSPSYSSPVYQQAVATWMAVFARYVAPWLATRGGPVIAVQVDDETCDYYHFGPFETDYNPAALAEFHRRHPGISVPRGWPAQSAGIAALRPALAWQQWKGQQIADWLARLAANLRAGSVDVPIIHEIELSLGPPADLAADAEQVLLTPELYPGSNGPEVLPLVELTAQAARAASRNRVPLWSTETQSGAVLLYQTLLGEGIIGALQFTYTTGVPTGSVTSTGRFGRTLRTAGPLLTRATRRADVAVVWDNSLTRLPYDTTARGMSTDARAVIEKHVPALATLLIRSGYSFDLLDTTAALPEDYRAYRRVFLASADLLPRAAQRALVAYVRDGGQLICWPAPPTLDETLAPCRLLADELFPIPERGFSPAADQDITLLGHPVTTYYGVHSYQVKEGDPGTGVTPVATFGDTVCGYRRRFGRGSATLLGSWLAADSVPGRAGTLIDSQPVPAEASPATTLALARTMATRHFGALAAAAVPDTLPGGAAQTLYVYAYTNQRRGGEYISGGALAYWNGDHVVGLAELNSTDTAPPAQRLPYRPADAAHQVALGALVGAPPGVRVPDSRIQARVLDGPGGAATIVAANRFRTPVPFAAEVNVGARMLRLPASGTLSLPPQLAVVLPINYPLGKDLRLRWSTAQLLTSAVNGRSLTLELWAPWTAETLVSLPAPVSRATVNGHPIATHATGRLVEVTVPAGESDLVLNW